MERLVPLRVRGEAAAVPTGSLLEVALVLTHACNLACTYCYTGEKKRVRMAAATAERALALALTTARERGARLQVGFFGGEPLIERDTLLAIASRARAEASTLPAGLSMQVTTNGTLLDAELVESLGRLGVHVAISVDGTAAQHDALRPMAGGQSSHAEVVAGLGHLLDARERWPFDAIAVVDPRTVTAMADGVRELCDRGVDAITLNMNWGGPWDEPSLAAFERGFEEVAAVFVAWLRRGRWVRIEPLASALHSLVDLGEVAPRECAAGRDRLAVAPSGRIYPCGRAVGEDTGRGAIGHLDDGRLPQARLGGCACARAEETGAVDRTGPVQLRHDRVVARVARRVLAVLGDEFERIHVVERGPNP